MKLLHKVTPDMCYQLDHEIEDKKTFDTHWYIREQHQGAYKRLGLEYEDSGLNSFWINLSQRHLEILYRELIKINNQF